MGWGGAAAGTALRVAELAGRAVTDSDLPLAAVPARFRAVGTDRDRSIGDHDVQLYVHRHGVYRATFATDREADGGAAVESSVRAGGSADREGLFPVAGEPEVEVADATPSLFESTVDPEAARRAVASFPAHDYERLTAVDCIHRAPFPGARWEPVFVDGESRYFDASPSRAAVLVDRFIGAVEDDFDDEAAALYLAGMAAYYPGAFDGGHVDRIDALVRPGSGVPGTDMDAAEFDEFLADVERLAALRGTGGDDVVSERVTLKEQLNGDYGYDTVSAAETLLATHDRAEISPRELGWVGEAGAPSRPDLLVRALAELYAAGAIGFTTLARPLRRPEAYPAPEGFRMLLQARAAVIDAAPENHEVVRKIVAAHDEIATGPHADLVDEVVAALPLSRR